MLAFLKKLFGRKPAREIFRYFDGSQERSADPLRIYFDLNEDPEAWDLAQVTKELGDISKIENPPPELVRRSRELTESTVARVQEVFGVDEFDPATGNGLTWEECLELLGAFLAFTDGVKKKQERLRTQLQPTESSTPADSIGASVLDAALSTGPPDISGDDLDALAEQLEQFKAANPMPADQVEATYARANSEVFGPPRDEDLSAFSDQPAEVSPPLPADQRLSTPSDSVCSSTPTASTSDDPLSASKQLLQLSTQKHSQKPSPTG